MAAVQVSNHIRRMRILWLVAVTAAFTGSLAAQAPRSGNPVLPGWYADPEANVFENAYWI